MADGFDNEILKALKFLRGDDKKKKVAEDAESETAAFLSQEVLDAIESQGEATTAQNAALLEAIREQNFVLNNHMTVLREQEEAAAAAEARTQTKTKVIYVTKNDPQSEEVTSAIAEAEAAIDAHEEEEAAAAATATAMTPPSIPVPIAVKTKEPIVIITGPWKFVESDVASKRRNRIEKNGTSDDILKKEDLRIVVAHH